MSARRPDPAVRLLPAAAAEEAATLQRLAAIINVAFEQSEGSMFPPGRRRISRPELASLVATGQIAVAERDGQVAGCIRITQLGPSVGEWGLLAVPPERQGQGIARTLVRFAEAALAARSCEQLQIQLLTPRAPELISTTKALSAAWYLRLGYEPGDLLNFAALHPESAALLTQACDFRTFVKLL